MPLPPGKGTLRRGAPVEVPKRHQSCWCPVLELAASRMVRNKDLLFKPPWLGATAAQMGSHTRGSQKQTLTHISLRGFLTVLFFLNQMQGSNRVYLPPHFRLPPQAEREDPSLPCSQWGPPCLESSQHLQNKEARHRYMQIRPVTCVLPPECPECSGWSSELVQMQSHGPATLTGWGWETEALNSRETCLGARSQEA